MYIHVIQLIHLDYKIAGNNDKNVNINIKIPIMLTTVTFLAFNCFQMYFLIYKKQCLSLTKKQKFQKRST